MLLLRTSASAFLVKTLWSIRTDHESMKSKNKPSTKAIRQSLERILKSAKFRGSYKQKKFLRFVVNETLKHRATQIKEYTIAISVYGRKEEFDPQVDPIVRVEAGRLRRALEYYYLTDGKNDQVRIEIPKGGYVPAFRTGEKPTPPTIELASEHKDDPLSNEPSIAVMPLTNLSGDNRQDYFVDGLTEELTNEFSRFQDFRVIASQSTMRFKGSAINPGKVGAELGARFLLMGSGRKSSKTVKISIQLLDAATGEQIWVEDYRRNGTSADLIDLQEEIAHSVVGVIADQYGLINRRLSKESRKKAPGNLQAYSAVLRFYHYETQLTTEAFKQALKALEKAVKIEPEFALAWAMLGHLYADNYALGFCELERPLEKAFEFANRGVALAPENQFARDALALAYFHKGEKTLFLQQVEKILELNPNSPYFVGVAGWHLMLFGEWERGLSLLRKGIGLNPYHPSWFHLATFLDYYRKDDFENALAEALKFNYPNLYLDPLLRAAVLGELGRIQEAKIAVSEMLKLEPNFREKKKELLAHYVKIDSLIRKLLKGLEKAGLDNCR